MKTAYWLRILIGFDMFANVVLGGRFDETISARVGLHHAWYDRAVADFLNDIQAHHTDMAREHDKERAESALQDLEG